MGDGELAQDHGRDLAWREPSALIILRQVMLEALVEVDPGQEVAPHWQAPEPPADRHQRCRFLAGLSPCLSSRKVTDMRWWMVAQGQR